MCGKCKLKLKLIIVVALAAIAAALFFTNANGAVLYSMVMIGAMLSSNEAPAQKDSESNRAFFSGTLKVGQKFQVWLAGDQTAKLTAYVGKSLSVMGYGIRVDRVLYLPRNDWQGTYIDFYIGNLDSAGSEKTKFGGI